MLYLLDANVLIVAHKTYYPIDQVPEFWEWLCYQGEVGNAKIPLEIMGEITEGRKEDDPLFVWMNDSNNRNALLLSDEADSVFVQRVVYEGYAPDLTDIEVAGIGSDPFLIAYALMGTDRYVVTTEVSKPRRQRQNRHVPDVCGILSVQWCNPFAFNRSLGFRTSWKSGLLPSSPKAKE